MKKIVIIGPESTGKSTLCEQLARHYHTDWCPEYAREYLLTHGRDYGYEDLLTIARGQLVLEDEHAARLGQEGAGGGGQPLLFIDTDMYVMKVWCEFVFGRCHPFILQQIVERHYDLYLLCDVDLPWVRDELREYPDLATRRTLHRIYQDILVNQAVPWAPIRGSYRERLQRAVEAVDRLLAEV
ncbi:MAG TPA: AAA family ATPase [Chitinophagaceae bacterium]|nr:AAA family ATPase [Chitinophagaceae bacterium]